MSGHPSQLERFSVASRNTTYELKRQMRIAAADSGLSRDQIVDGMNEISVREGMRQTIGKATLENWFKDSDPGRLPSPPWLTIFCDVVRSLSPINALCAPVGGRVLDAEASKKLAWAEAELAKKKAAIRARLALELLEV